MNEKKIKPSEPIGKSDQPDSSLFNSKNELEESNSIKSGTCTYKGREYNEGATICINGDQYKCGGSGGWYKTGRSC